MDGEGTYTWAEGVKYTGQWKEGKLNGKGSIIWPDKTRVDGIFENNRLVSEQ
jgi:1-phosphatidylinositol-4-phosphate 5-kinase